MTDETAVALKENTHLMIPVHLLENDLEDMTREDLLDMVQDMGLTAKDDATKEDLRVPRFHGQPRQQING